MPSWLGNDKAEAAWDAGLYESQELGGTLVSICFDVSYPRNFSPFDGMQPRQLRVFPFQKLPSPCIFIMVRATLGMETFLVPCILSEQRQTGFQRVATCTFA